MQRRKRHRPLRASSAELLENKDGAKWRRRQCAGLRNGRAWAIGVGRRNEPMTRLPGLDKMSGRAESVSFLILALASLMLIGIAAADGSRYANAPKQETSGTETSLVAHSESNRISKTVTNQVMVKPQTPAWIIFPRTGFVGPQC